MYCVGNANKDILCINGKKKKFVLLFREESCSFMWEVNSFCFFSLPWQTPRLWNGLKRLNVKSCQATSTGESNTNNWKTKSIDTMAIKEPRWRQRRRRRRQRKWRRRQQPKKKYSLFEKLILVKLSMSWQAIWQFWIVPMHKMENYPTALFFKGGVLFFYKKGKASVLVAKAKPNVTH